MVWTCLNPFFHTCSEYLGEELQKMTSTAHLPLSQGLLFLRPCPLVILEVLITWKLCIDTANRSQLTVCLCLEAFTATARHLGLQEEKKRRSESLPCDSSHSAEMCAIKFLVRTSPLEVFAAEFLRRSKEAQVPDQSSCCRCSGFGPSVFTPTLSNRRPWWDLPCQELQREIQLV